MSDKFTIITTHLNTDFDGFASAVAAHILYPRSVIVLPGSMERPLRKFIATFLPDEIPMKKLKDLDSSSVKRLVVVDTCHKKRVGSLSRFLDRDDIEVILYDHHGPLIDMEAECIRADKAYSSTAGANTTFMTGLIRERGLPLPAPYATLFLVAIHEDTGSFTYTSTTPEDLVAASWLLEQGADVEQLAQVMNSRMTPGHISLLNDLIETAEIYQIGGHDIAIAKTSSAGYVEDFAVIAHELMDIRQFSVLFVLILMSDRVLVVGRSRSASVDTGAVLSGLGGGGHEMAASATLKGLTLTEAEERLVSQLEKVLGTEPRVQDIMSSPVIYTEPDTPLYEVHDMINLYGISGIPVVEDGKIKGLISRSTVEKAIHHGLARLPVREYMSTDFLTASKDDGISVAREIMIERNQRFVPVLDGGRLEGVVTRTDLLRMLAENPARHPGGSSGTRERKRNIASLMRQNLPAHVVDFLRTAGKVAEEMGMQVYVVGGFVRDLLLRVKNFDIDLVVEGDGIAFAAQLAREFDARVKSHEKFQTAVIILPDNFWPDAAEQGFKVDVATARWEYYEYPAAMPTVALSSIKLDLFRRDFTINTLSVRLNPKSFGTLVDFFGAQRDIKEGIVRVLHSLSFIEDPTRVLRAVRFEQRYNFRIGKHTLNLIKNAVRLNVFARLSGRRLERELRLLLEEQDPRPAIKRCAELDILKFIHPDLKIDSEVSRLLDATYDVLAWYQLLFRPEPVRQWMLYLMAMLAGLGSEALAGCIERLGYSESMRRILINQLRQGRKAARELGDDGMTPGKTVRLLDGLAPEVILHLMAASEDRRVTHWISRYITTLQDVKIQIGGDDLKKAGIPPGPVYRKIFDQVLTAVLDGKVTTRQEQLALAETIARNENLLPQPSGGILPQEQG